MRSVTDQPPQGHPDVVTARGCLEEEGSLQGPPPPPHPVQQPRAKCPHTLKLHGTPQGPQPPLIKAVGFPDAPSLPKPDFHAMPL